MAKIPVPEIPSMDILMKTIGKETLLDRMMMWLTQTIRKWLNKFLVKDVLSDDDNAGPILKRFGVVRYL
jgi:hypothetical protein